MHSNFEPLDSARTDGDSCDINNSPGGRRSRTSLIAATIAATVIATSVAGFAAVRAIPNASAPMVSDRALDLDSPTNLNDTTLGELANDLAEFGLQVEVTPTDAVIADSEQVDPFQGLTDTEIDALTDDQYFGRLEAAGIDLDEYFDEYFDEDQFDDEEPIASAPIDGDAIDVSELDSLLATQAQDIWGRFSELIPIDQRQMISSFEIALGDASGAYVHQDDGDPTKWVLGVSRGLGPDLDAVLIHEFGHLLTLQAKEVPPDTNEDGCSTYFTGEGCALSGSTVAEFVQRFWPRDQIDEINRLEEQGDDYGLEAFYADHASGFVTDYAATNPGEDLAETIATFVLEARPAGNTIANQKVQMLWNDAEMVAIRDQIRANL